jgi:hypothetical protein
VIIRNIINKTIVFKGGKIMYLDNENEEKIWEEIAKDKERGFIFTYSLRFPKQSKTGEFEILIKKYMYREGSKAYPLYYVRRVGGHESDKIVIRTNEGTVNKNSVWFFGHAADEHREEAIAKLIEFQEDKIKRIEEIYLQDVKETNEVLEFLRSSK